MTYISFTAENTLGPSWIIILLYFVTCHFFVMVGGAASTLNQQYGLPSWVGGVVLTALAILTVVRGLNSLVDKIGVVGPAIVVLCIGIGVVTLFRDAGHGCRTGSYPHRCICRGRQRDNQERRTQLGDIPPCPMRDSCFCGLPVSRQRLEPIKKKDVEYGILRRNHRCMCCHCPYHAGYRLPILIQQVWEIQASSYGMQTSPT